VNPFGLHEVQPRALLGQKAADNSHPTATLFNPSVMLSEPTSDLLALVPASVVPDKEQNLLVRGFEPLAAPQKKPGRYAAYGATVHKAQPRLFKLRQEQPVAREMALGSGSSLATDCSTNRKGFPASAQLLRAGCATLLHQVSSSKAVAHSGLSFVRRISRSGRLFSLV